MGCHHLLDDVVILMNNINLDVLGVHIDVLEFGGSPFPKKCDQRTPSIWLVVPSAWVGVKHQGLGFFSMAHENSYDE